MLKKVLKRINICFGSWVQKVQSMVGQPRVLKQSITLGRRYGEGQPFTHCEKEVKMGRGQGQGSLENICPVIFPQ